MVDPYIDVISKWAGENNAISLTALDLGCGDFHVGSRVFPMFKNYIAADIVPNLIDSHRQSHLAENLEFHCIDAIDEELPQGDVIFIRQVLQHLSNSQILKILPKIYQFEYAIISEHVPSASSFKTKNSDKIHGGGTRISNGSGVYLEDVPFLFKVIDSVVLLEVPAGPDSEVDGLIVTTCYRLK